MVGVCPVLSMAHMAALTRALTICAFMSLRVVRIIERLMGPSAASVNAISVNLITCLRRSVTSFQAWGDGVADAAGASQHFTVLEFTCSIVPSMAWDIPTVSRAAANAALLRGNTSSSIDSVLPAPQQVSVGVTCYPSPIRIP